jgi:hypothetical protein
MGKYSSFSHPRQKPRDRGVHPIMRGIGCILMVVVPILSYGIAVLLVGYGVKRGWPIPPEWFGPPTIHPLLLKVQGLQIPLAWLQGQINLEAYFAFAVVITIVIGVVITMFYGYIYAIFGPSRYGPQDAPPIKGRKIKPYKR